ncbi:MAG: phage major capsid protein [Rikenellaceae bacterium]
MGRLKKLREERATKLDSLKSIKDAGETRSLTGDESTNYNSLVDEISTLNSQIETEERAQKLLADQGKQVITERSKEEQDKEYRNAWKSYIVGGSEYTTEQRSLIEKRAAISGVAGTALVPEEMASSIEVALKEYGGMFSAAKVVNTSTGADLVMPTVDDTAKKATIVNEYAESSTSKPTFSSITLKAYTYRTDIIPISLELLQDAAFDMNSVITGLLSDNYGRGANEHFTTGTGTGEPKGIVTAATAGVTAAATEITRQNLIDLIKSVDGVYAKKGKFMMNSRTLWDIMAITDDNGRPLIEATTVGGVTPKLLGKEYILNEDMPDIGAGKTSVLFGALDKYVIRMVKGFTIKRLDETYAPWLSVGIMGFARADGTLLDAGTHPVKKLVHAAS